VVFDLERTIELISVRRLHGRPVAREGALFF
jgi:hypothetical protein